MSLRKLGEDLHKALDQESQASYQLQGMVSSALVEYEKGKLESFRQISNGERLTFVNRFEVMDTAIATAISKMSESSSTVQDQFGTIIRDLADHGATRAAQISDDVKSINDTLDQQKSDYGVLESFTGAWDAGDAK